MTRYYVEYRSIGGKLERTSYYDKFDDAYDKYLEILEKARNTDWAKDAYKTTKIITNYRVR